MESPHCIHLNKHYLHVSAIVKCIQKHWLLSTFKTGYLNITIIINGFTFKIYIQSSAMD
jgi:hypothetical protein